uniref:Uncharacterized protein n=1 Tax=Myotis myotis TaxID=51298 RepID=A0A7J7RLR8_MYOMY|nr:hypothetical protein mMyoMyo1_010277 [Myotis myotis]
MRWRLTSPQAWPLLPWAPLGGPEAGQGQCACSRPTSGAHSRSGWALCSLSPALAQRSVVTLKTKHGDGVRPRQPSCHRRREAHGAARRWPGDVTVASIAEPGPGGGAERLVLERRPAPLGLWRSQHQPGSAETDQWQRRWAPCVGDRPAGGAGGLTGFRRHTGPTSRLPCAGGRPRRAGV